MHSRFTVVDEARPVSSLELSETNGLQQRASSACHQFKSHPDSTPKFLVQFRMLTAVLRAASLVFSTVNKEQHICGCRNGLRKTSIRGFLLLAQNVLQDPAPIQQRWREGLPAERYKELLSNTGITTCSGLHRHGRP